MTTKMERKILPKVNPIAKVVNKPLFLLLAEIFPTQNINKVNNIKTTSVTKEKGRNGSNRVSWQRPISKPAVTTEVIRKNLKNWGVDTYNKSFRTEYKTSGRAISTNKAVRNGFSIPK